MPPHSFQNLAELLRRLPGLLIADVGVAHGSADVCVAEQLLDLAQILSHVVKQDRRRALRTRPLLAKGKFFTSSAALSAKLPGRLLRMALRRPACPGNE